MRKVLPLLAALLVASACSRSATETTTTTSSTTTTVSTTTTEPTTTSTTAPTTTTEAGTPSPLNGLPVADSSLLQRRVVAVKIDNHPAARPQSGLEEADAVVELLVEGGITRFMALFHDTDSAYVGPIRSGRPTDPTIVQAVGATFVISGAAYWVLALFRRLRIPFFTEVRPATFRISSRRAPHNLYGDTVKMRAEADRRGYSNDPPRAPLFAWGDLPQEAAPATDITLSWSRGTTVVWKWTGDRYERYAGSKPQDWRAADGRTGVIDADTLVVLEGTEYTAHPPHPSDGKSLPATETTGSGRALVFAGGKVAEGRWSRERATDPFTLTRTDGSPLLVPPGHLWISVFPSNRPISW